MDEEAIIKEEVSGIYTSRHYRYAGFWMRFWAFLLDGIIIFSIQGLLVYPFLRWQELQQETVWIFPLNGLLAALVTLFYFVILTKYWSQTLGKRVFGLKVIPVNGNALTWSAVIFREGIGRFIIQSFTFMYLLYLVVAFSEVKQGIHDRIADTLVIHEE